MKDGFAVSLVGAVARLDARLLAVPPTLRRLLLVATVAAMAVQAVPNVPRSYADLRPWLGDIQRYEGYGPDSLSDMYGSRVILNDVWDMYTKAGVDQTPAEAATWTREASAPYPPVVLLVDSLLYAAGDAIGIGFYGMILCTAGLFLVVSLAYFIRTRWYAFPLLYLNFGYLGYRFVYVQDNTYLVTLTTLMLALLAARAGWPLCHGLVALATTMKLSPLFYVTQVFGMSRKWRMAYLGVLTTGLVLPYFIWDNYLYIYRYGNELKGDTWSTLAALVVAVPFGAALWYVQEKRGFDLEDRVGWGVVPFALFLAFKMNVARHLILVLLIPDKRGLRNVAAAVGLLVPALVPSLVAFNSSLAIATAVLTAGLVWHLQQIGWATVRQDLRRPWTTVRTLVAQSRRTLQN